MGDPLLTPKDVKALLSVGLRTVYSLAERGTLPTVKIPGTALVRFRRERVEELLKRWERNGRGRRSAPERETPEAQPGEDTPPAMEGKGEAKTTTFESTAQPR